MYKNRTILVAEDHEPEIILLQIAFAQAGIKAAVHFVRDGQEALDYLKKKGVYGDIAAYGFPDLFLLDLKMPGMDGLDVLEWVRKQTFCDCMVVVVLTSSDDSEDIKRAYQLRANSYLIKPFGARTDFVESVCQYWLGTNICPSQYPK